MVFFIYLLIRLIIYAIASVVVFGVLLIAVAIWAVFTVIRLVAEALAEPRDVHTPQSRWSDRR
jgi:hypothetical protein